MHFLGNSRIDVGGDVAHAETYCVAYLRSLPRDDGSQMDMTMGLRYVDRYERRDGGPWLVAHRVVVYDWNRIDPVEKWFDRTPEVVVGRRTREDVSYDARDTTALP